MPAVIIMGSHYVLQQSFTWVGKYRNRALFLSLKDYYPTANPVPGSLGFISLTKLFGTLLLSCFHFGDSIQRSNASG